MQNSKSHQISHMRNGMGRKPSGRINFCLRIDKHLYERLKEISEATQKPIADLIEHKIIELIALFDANLENGSSGSGGIRTLDLRRVRVSLKEIYNKHRRQFIKFLEKRIKKGELSNVTARNYISAIETYLKDVYYPTELEELILNVRGDKFAKGLRNFFNFLEEEKGISAINGINLEKWRSKTFIRRYKAREKFISDEELKEAYYSYIRKINDEERELVFLVLVFSGLRLKQVVEALQNYDESNVVEVNEKVKRYPVGFVSKGQKKAFWLYYPSWLELKRLSKGYAFFKDNLAYKRVSANTIRKWHYNFLILNGVPESVADFIQGRASVTVGSAHYLAKTKQADEWYSRIVDKFPLEVD